VALRDSWHKMLVYFGLAEERDRAYDDVDSYDDEPDYEERAPARKLSAPPRRPRREEFDDIWADEPAGRSPRLRPVEARNGGNVRVHLVIPKSFNDAQQIADRFKDGIPVVINLQSSETELNKRLIDFASGLTYALDGGMQRVADKVFMLTPQNVDLSAEERAQLIEKGFFNQA
jgi:cell division inhibitor SepF